ncbi:MAG TPA: MBL fold metallo-hydrolase [Candidatus Cloacimonadota bacterium]|nr:MBL fold metallo-hydrolase [Candidatus Cloacimonadota bacterium]
MTSQHNAVHFNWSRSSDPCLVTDVLSASTERNVCEIHKTLRVILFVLFLSLEILLPFAQLQIQHLDVGQGDGTLIVTPSGLTILIDAGNNGKGTGVVLPYLNSLGITQLDFVIASHYHADHIGGLDEVINGLGAVNVGIVYDRGTDAPLPGTVTYTDYVAAAAAAGRVTISLGQVIDLGDGATLTCLAVDGDVLDFGHVADSDSSENDLSIAFLLSWNRFQYFTGGDCGGETTYYADLETPLAPLVGDVDAFKINHHGSAYSTNQVFVDALQPEVGVISVGDGNSYGHPVQAVLNRLAAAGCAMYLTEAGAGGTLPAGSGWVADGPIVLTTDGYSYSMAFGITSHLYPCDDLDPGDVNSDGLVGLVDLVILHQYLAGNVAPGELPFLAHLGIGDVNGDGDVDGIDLVDLAGWLAGM